MTTTDRSQDRPKRSVLSVFLLSFLTLSPFYFKGHQLILAEVDFLYWWNAFGWEGCFVLICYGGFVQPLSFVRGVTLMGAMIFNLLLVLETASYLQFGLDLQAGGFSRVLQNGLHFVTWELVLRVAGVLGVFTCVHLLPVLAFRHFRMKRLILFGLALLYLCLVLIWPPNQRQVETLSLMARVQGFFADEKAAPAVTNAPDQSHSQEKHEADLPFWEVNKSGTTSLPKGYYVIPHIPDPNSPFTLELILNNPAENPEPASFDLFNLGGENIGSHPMELSQGEKRVNMRQAFPEASYAILKTGPKVQALAYLTGMEKVRIPYQLTTNLAREIVISGDVGSGNHAAFVFVNIQDHTDQVVLKINGDEGWNTEETLNLQPGEKRMLLFSTEDDRHVDIKVTGEAVVHYLLRWDTHNNLYK